MKKEWNYNGIDYTMERKGGYGQYVLNGYHFTDSSVWDNVDNEDEPERQEKAMRVAEAFINTKY